MKLFTLALVSVSVCVAGCGQQTGNEKVSAAAAETSDALMSDNYDLIITSPSTTNWARELHPDTDALLFTDQYGLNLSNGSPNKPLASTLEFYGAYYFNCQSNSPPKTVFFGSVNQPLTRDSETLSQVASHDCGAQPASSHATIYYRPTASNVWGAAPFVDSNIGEGDGWNFFEESQSTMVAGTVSHSAGLSLLYGTTPASEVLALRYSQTHNASSFIDVSIMNPNTGSTLYSVRNVRFVPTPQSSDFDHWGVLRIPFTSQSNWPANVYIRLAFRSGGTTFFDAVWLETSNPL